MISLIITLIILILVVILSIYGFNSLLRSTVDKFVNNNENFENFENSNTLNNIPFLDACKKLDKPLKETLNTQTGTNIPLSPIFYNDHVGKTNIYKNKKNNELKEGCYCINQNELLYDGIWKSEVNNMKNGLLNQNWSMTNGNVINDYICSDKFIQVNKTLPEDYIDNTNIYENEVDTDIYFNDKKDDPLDLQINCFPSEFNKGITNCTNNYI